MRSLLLLLALAPAIAAASDTDEQFARDMLTCGYKFQAYSFAPGDASISQQATGQVDIYIAAATTATNAGFVEHETPALKEKALNDALAEFAAIEGGNEGLLAAWGAVKELCDQRIKARQRAVAGR
jgi:hypothetical protein